MRAEAIPPTFARIDVAPTGDGPWQRPESICFASMFVRRSATLAKPVQMGCRYECHLERQGGQRRTSGGLTETLENGTLNSGAVSNRELGLPACMRISASRGRSIRSNWMPIRTRPLTGLVAARVSP